MHPNDHILTADFRRNPIWYFWPWGTSGHDCMEMPNRLDQNAWLEHQGSSFITLQSAKSKTEVKALVTYNTPTVIWARFIDLMPFANIRQGCGGSPGIKRGPRFLVLQRNKYRSVNYVCILLQTLSGYRAYKYKANTSLHVILSPVVAGKPLISHCWIFPPPHRHLVEVVGLGGQLFN